MELWTKCRSGCGLFIRTRDLSLHQVREEVRQPSQEVMSHSLRKQVQMEIHKDMPGWPS